MTDERANSILVVLILLSVPVYPIAIPLWMLAIALNLIHAYR